MILLMSAICSFVFIISAIIHTIANSPDKFEVWITAGIFLLVYECETIYNKLNKIQEKMK